MSTRTEVMPSRTASCTCGQLRIRVEGEPRALRIGDQGARFVFRFCPFDKDPT